MSVITFIHVAGGEYVKAYYRFSSWTADPRGYLWLAGLYLMLTPILLALEYRDLDGSRRKKVAIYIDALLFLTNVTLFLAVALAALTSGPAI
jgi:hypothetical protein